MYTVGEAAEATGVSAKMIRHYEEIGVMPAPQRAANGYRSFSDTDVRTLRFIRRARDLGFTIEQIRRLVALWRDRSRSSAEVKRIALGHIDELDRKLRETRAMRDELAYLAEHCHGDERPECPILDDLAGEDGPKADSDAA